MTTGSPWLGEVDSGREEEVKKDKMGDTFKGGRGAGVFAVVHADIYSPL